MIQIFLAFVVGSLIVAFLGRNHKFGFWGNFFASMLLSPLIGLLLVLSGTPKTAPKAVDSAPGQDCETRQS
jgi:hypothetical protein